MVKSVQPNNNNAVNPNSQNSDSNNNSGDSFQSYLNADPSTVVHSSNTPTPYQLMSSPTSPNFGPPPSASGGPLEPAPENFGPPQIGSTATNNTSSTSSNFGSPQASKNNLNNSANNLKVGPNQKSTPQKTTAAPTPVIPAKPTQSYQKVKKMEENAMMQDAITHMKVKDPDPGAWQ